MNRGSFVVPPAVVNMIKDGREKIADAIASGNPPEIFRVDCDKCGARAWEYRWGNHWRCVECGVWKDAAPPEPKLQCIRCYAATGEYDDGMCYLCYHEFDDSS